MTETTTPTARRRLVEPTDRQLRRLPAGAEIAATYFDKDGRQVYEFEWSTAQ